MSLLGIISESDSYRMKKTSYELEACRTNHDLFYVCFHTITSNMAKTDKQASTNLATLQHHEQEK